MITPAQPNQLVTQVNQLMLQKQFSQALELSQSINQSFPDHADAWLTTAMISHQMNLIHQADTSMAQARKLQPHNLGFAYQEMMMLDQSNRPELALKLAQSLVGKPLPHQEMHVQLAHILNKNEDFPNSLTMYEHLSEYNPNHPGWLLKQAMVLLNLGRIDDAKEKSKQALALQKNHPDVLFFRSHLEKQTATNNHIQALKSHTQESYKHPADLAKIYFSLAKELEDCHQFKESFDARMTGCDLFRKSFQYDLSSDLAFMQQIRKVYDQSFINKTSPHCESDEPIFIVGLPRSGTTLLDRIISSHSEVLAAGELKQFNHCTLHNLKQLNINPSSSRTTMVDYSAQMDFHQLGNDYIRTSRTRTGHSLRFTDKFPQNSYYVGMILKALPNAKIIIMQRHPVAVCYAVLKQMFNHDSYPFSYDLIEMAEYYIEHNKLLNHWQSVGGDAVKTVFYEDLVVDIENQSKSIYQFLGLDWQPSCLDFHKNKQPTATASASQVRQKLYTGSIDMWQNYETQLQPLIDRLKKAGCI